MALSTWDEIRTAYHVARSGTVSGAADVLGVHHATVIRHVDALEERLGVKLFQRHARGYTPTEAGSDLMQVAQATDDQFTQLMGRIKGQGDSVSGELVVTSLTSASSKLTPVLAAFQADHPGLKVRYITGEEVLRLEYGEAHVAIRAGAAPEQLDNVVQRLTTQKLGLFASKEYLARRGAPETEADWRSHDFVGYDKSSRAPFNRWMADFGGPDQIVFRSGDGRVVRDAILAGVGIGFVSCWEAALHDGLVPVVESHPDWGAPLWIVTHVDLHRTTKVQAFLKVLKEAAKNW